MVPLDSVLKMIPPQPSIQVHRGSARLLALLLAAGLAAACEPTVRVEAPREPITINLNIKLDADVRVKLEEQAEQDIDANPDIF
jgi:hypothetical protein